MKITKNKLGEVRFIDCMDEENGLPSLETDSIELGLTDPPFNQKFKGTKQKGKKEEYYEDDLPPEVYKEWCSKWFAELRRVTKAVVMTCGNRNIWMWSDIEHPKGQSIHYKPNCQGGSSVAHLTKYDSILVWGKLPNKLKLDVIVENIKTGKNRELCEIHSCPSCYNLWYRLLDEIKPTRVIDPFMGSGTTAHAATVLGIGFLGYEKLEKFKPDIDNRIKVAPNFQKKKKKKGIDW